MEDWTIRRLDLQEAEFYFELAYRDDHVNSPNYEFSKMEARWEKYIEFNILEDDFGPVAMGGIYQWSENLARVVDRFYVFPAFRAGARKSGGLFSHGTASPKAAVDFMIPYQVSRANTVSFFGMECFISIQEKRKRRAAEALAKQLGPDWTLLPDMYRTADGEYGIQNILATNEGKITRKTLPISP